MVDLEKRLVRIIVEYEDTGKSFNTGRTFEVLSEGHLVMPLPRQMMGRTGPIAICLYESDAKKIGAGWGPETTYKKVAVKVEYKDHEQLAIDYDNDENCTEIPEYHLG